MIKLNKVAMLFATAALATAAGALRGVAGDALMAQ